MTRTSPTIAVLDADTYAHGNPETFGLPLEQYAYLRDEEPVYLQKFDDPMLVDRVWVLSRYEDLWNADRDPATFAANRGFLNIWRNTPADPHHGGMPAMLTYDGEAHKRNRSVISKVFTPKVVAALEDRFRRIAVEVAEATAKRRDPFNYVTEVAHRMPMEALGEVLGVPPADRARFFGWVDVFAAPFDQRIAPSFDHVMQATEELMAYSADLADRKLAEPGDDVMSSLAAARAAGTISHEEILGNVSVLAAGAAESTRTALSHGMHELMRNPEQFAWLRERAEDIPLGAMHEMVRIATPFTHFVRTATRDVKLHGVTIPEGELVCLLFPSGNFDPEGITDPTTFDLSREKNEHLSFGRGPHMCLGRHVATLEMKILLEELLQRIQDFRPAGEISYIRDAYSRGVYELPVTITPR